MRLNDGDRLPEVLEAFAIEKHVSSAVCFFLGGITKGGKVVVGPIDGNELPINPMVRVLDGIHEVCGIGTIFKNEQNKPKLHMHASFGRGSNAVAGCIRLGIEIWKIGEIILLEILNSDACRLMDGKTGFEFLEIKTKL